MRPIKRYFDQVSEIRQQRGVHYQQQQQYWQQYYNQQHHHNSDTYQQQHTQTPHPQTLTQPINATQNSHTHYRKNMYPLNNDTLQIMREQRKTNLIFFGVPEFNDIKTESDQKRTDRLMIEEILENLNLAYMVSSNSIVDLIRQGAKIGTKPRSLKVVFSSVVNAQIVYMHAPNLRHSRCYKGIHISRDLIKEDRIISKINYMQKKAGYSNVNTDQVHYEGYATALAATTVGTAAANVTPSIESSATYGNTSYSTGATGGTHAYPHGLQEILVT